MSRQLRHNFSDPAIRSALVQAVNGAPPSLETTPRLQSAPGSYHGSAPDSPADIPHFLHPTTSSRLRHKAEDTMAQAGRAAGTDESLQHRGRRRGDRPFLYVPTLNAKPIPLRGGGRGGVPETSANSARSGGSDPAEEANQLAQISHQVDVSSSNVEGARPYPVACSISTPVNSSRREYVLSEGGTADFHLQMQSTRNRLASLEAEQRKLIDNSLGALVKAACTMGSPGRSHRDSLPSVSTFTRGSPLGSSRGQDSSYFAELPGDTTMVPNSDPTKHATDAMALQSSDINVGRLEDENRLLREAISRARKKNDEIVAKCKEVEIRSKLLEEENKHVAQQLSSETSITSAPYPCAGVDYPTRKEAARRALLQLSSTAGKTLEDLFTRRSNLQAIMSSNGPELAVDGM